VWRRGSSERGCRYFGRKEKHERNPMTQEQKGRLVNTQIRRKGEEKSFGHKRAVCPVNNDRRLSAIKIN